MTSPSEDFRKRRRARELQTCVHFNGVQHKTCDAGVDYASVRQKPESGPGYNMPCLPSMQGGPCLDNCPKRVAQTEADLDAQDADIAARFKKIATAREAIVKHAGPHKKGTDAAGFLACPACGTGKLNYRRSGYNGHIHAGCSTAGCVSWME